MRVLVVDQDATLLEALVRALAGQFTIDVLTNKSDCVDLLRKTEYEVIVACERLGDGSGLELLGQVAKRAPDTLRVFAAERERLALLRGKLGPFNLFATLAYPIEPRKLLSTLVAAAENLHSEGGSAPIEHIVLSSDPETPQAPTAGTPLVRQTISRDEARPAAPARPERRQALRPPQTSPAVPAAPAPPAGRTVRARPAHMSRAGSPATTTSPAAAVTPRPFAAQEDVAEIAAAARASPQEPKSSATRTAFIAGAGVAVAVVGVVLAVRFLSGGHVTHTANTAQVAAPPHYAQDVVDLVTRVESDFTQDDFRKAQADIQLLRSLAPDHPRLPFFQSLIAHHTAGRRAEPSETAVAHAPTPGPASKHDRQPTRIASPPTPKPTEVAPPPPKSPAPASPPSPASPPAAPSASDGGTQFATATSSIAPPRGPLTDAPPAASAAVNSTFSGRTVEDSTEAGATGSAPTAPNPHKLGSGEPPAVVAPAQLTRRVAPEYPPAAARQGLEGFAEVRFTVTAKGTVTDVSIVESTPPDVFDKAAIDAVRRWRYDPRTVDGQPTETQVQVRLQFKMDSRR